MSTTVSALIRSGVVPVGEISIPPAVRTLTLPLLPWISGLVGAVPWIMLAAMCALFPAVFGAIRLRVAESSLTWAVTSSTRP